MREYTTGYYQGRDGNKKRTIMLIMDDQERRHLAQLITQLEIDVANGRKNKTIKRWTKKDAESITFLKRTTHFGTFPESEMIDWTEHQIATLVCKTIDKVYAHKFDASKTPHYFPTWCGFKIRDSMSHHQIKNWMEHKRDLLRASKLPKVETSDEWNAIYNEMVQF